MHSQDVSNRKNGNNISTINTNLNKRNQLTDDQPNVKHLEVGGGWEDLPHLDDDRCHDDMIRHGDDDLDYTFMMIVVMMT